MLADRGVEHLRAGQLLALEQRVDQVDAGGDRRHRGGPVGLNFTTWYDGPLSDARGGAGLAIAESCWKFGIVMMPAAPFFAA